MDCSARNLVICLDGTWNNAVARSHTGIFYTNVVKVSRAIERRTRDDPLHRAGRHSKLASEDARAQIVQYQVGVGARPRYAGLSNRIVHLIDSVLGGVHGAGFEAGIDSALINLALNYDPGNRNKPGDRLFLFGFSRGAAQAQGLTRFIDWLGGLPTRHNAYFLPLLFKHYIDSGGEGDPASVRTSRGKQPDELVPVEVVFLGVWDTVVALGSRLRSNERTSAPEQTFHVGARPASCVRHARQALAVDERRFDFRPEIWIDSRPDQTLEQRWFPGSHSDVGGGSLEGGLSNLSFHWMMDEAESLGLEVDRSLTKYFVPYAQDTLHPSWTRKYRTWEWVRRRRGRGVRSLVNQPRRARLSLDRSVLDRICSQPGAQSPFLDLYRPENVLEFLAAQRDLDAYLMDVGLNSGVEDLPADVRARIKSLRGDTISVTL